MRYRILLLLILILVVLLLAGISGKTDSSLPINPKVVPEYRFLDGLGYNYRGGQLVIDLLDDPKTFNPLFAFESSSDAVLSQLHGTILEVAPRHLSRLGEPEELIYEPGVIAAFEISSDLHHLALFLRQGLKFSDGHPLTSEDIVFTLRDVVLNPEIKGLRGFWEGLEDLQVEARGEWLVVISMPDPDNPETVIPPQLLANLANQVVLPKHKLEQAVIDGTFSKAWGINEARLRPEEIVGTGPFRLKSYTVGQNIVLERNPYYWKVDPEGWQLPYLDELLLRIVPDDNQRLLRFASGLSQIIRVVPEDEVFLRGELERQGIDASKAIYVPIKANTTGDSAFIPNHDTADPDLRRLFRDERFRRALSYALNRERIIKNCWLGHAEPRCSPGLAESFWIGNDLMKEIDWCRFDLDEAERLLDEIGLKDIDGDGVRELPESGKEVAFELLVSSGERIPICEANHFAEDLAMVGIKANVTPIHFTVIVQRVLTNRFEMVRLGLSGGGDPNFIRDIYGSCGALHIYKPSDCKEGEPSEERTAWQVEVDKIFDEQAMEIKPGKRQELIAELQRILAENVPIIWSVKGKDICAYRYDKIANFRCPFLELDATIKNSEIIFRRD